MKRDMLQHLQKQGLMMGCMGSDWCLRKFLRVLQESLGQRGASTGHTTSTNPVLKSSCCCCFSSVLSAAAGEGEKEQKKDPLQVNDIMTSETRARSAKATLVSTEEKNILTFKATAPSLKQQSKTQLSLVIQTVF